MQSLSPIPVFDAAKVHHVTVDGATMNCKWRGTRLRELPIQAGGTEVEEAHSRVTKISIDSAEKTDRDDIWDRVPALQDMSISSVIGVPAANKKVERVAVDAIDVK